MNTITILIADDHKLIRESWAFMLNDNALFKVVAECGDTDQALRLSLEYKPDIIIMDINMGPVNGIDATERICKDMPGAKVIGLSMHAQPVYAKKMLRMGAMGYVTKNSPREEMYKAILEVHQGNKYICDEIKVMMAKHMQAKRENAPGINKLSYREMEISEYIKKGYSSKEIAADLNISFKTVEVHRHNILRKLGVKNSVSLVNAINSTTD